MDEDVAEEILPQAVVPGPQEESYDWNDTEDEDVVEEILPQAVVPAPQEEPYDWSELDRFTALVERVKDRLEEKELPDADKQFFRALSDFMSEHASLEEIQSSLKNVLELADDPSLSAEFAEFLDAPLDSEEKRATAHAALCRILGNCTTEKQKANFREIEESTRTVIFKAGHCWHASDNPKFRAFVHKFIEYHKFEEEEQRRKDLREMAGSQTELQDLLNKHYQEVGKYEVRSYWP
ncbi:hypothetical protein F5Y19DRAFT_433926 [Xylariaceae sp. FL1651]|nr:hypothetical protein F5Y19DRAFT_433926 [Xylariaceae sp. FL1651]